MHVYACLLLCFISMFACLDLGFSMLCVVCGLLLVDLWGHLLMWLLSSLLQIVWVWSLVRYTSVVSVCLMHTLSPLYAMFCLPCLLCATRLAFFAFLHIFMLTYMFMHESVCHPYSNPMELWLSNPNLHPSILLVCFPSSCFFACLLACFLCLCM